MSRNCYCKVCGRPTDCNGEVCELCECYMDTNEGIQTEFVITPNPPVEE